MSTFTARLSEKEEAQLEEIMKSRGISTKNGAIAHAISRYMALETEVKHLNSRNHTLHMQLQKAKDAFNTYLAAQVKLKEIRAMLNGQKGGKDANS